EVVFVADCVVGGGVCSRVVGAHENCPGASTGTPADLSVLPIGSNDWGGSASSVSPVGALDDHDWSSAGARTSTPAGASHRSEGRAPCQRTANDSVPARNGQASTVIA